MAEETKDKPRAVSACVSQANTPESDAREIVMHDVTMSDGTVVQMEDRKSVV